MEVQKVRFSVEEPGNCCAFGHILQVVALQKSLSWFPGVC